MFGGVWDEIQTWEAASLEESLKMNSAYATVSLVSKARPQEQLCSLGPSFPWIGKVTEERLRNLSLEGTVPHFTRSCSLGTTEQNVVQQ